MKKARPLERIISELKYFIKYRDYRGVAQY